MKICFRINLCHGSYLIWSLQMILCGLWNRAVRIVQSFRSVAVRPLPELSLHIWAACQLLLLNSHTLVLNKPAGTPRSIETHGTHCLASVSYFLTRPLLYAWHSVWWRPLKESAPLSSKAGSLSGHMSLLCLGIEVKTWHTTLLRYHSVLVAFGVPAGTLFCVILVIMSRKKWNVSCTNARTTEAYYAWLQNRL